MKKLLYTFLILLITPITYAGGLAHPLDFKGTEKERNYVISYIKDNVKEQYTKIGMGDPSTLRMMEKEELKSFKGLTKVKNKKLLDGVINQYCNIGMCNYSTILMMYNEQNKASKKSWSGKPKKHNKSSNLTVRAT